MAYCEWEKRVVGEMVEKVLMEKTMVGQEAMRNRGLASQMNGGKSKL